MKKIRYEVAKKERGIYILQQIIEEHLGDRGSIQVYPIFVGNRKECLEQKEVLKNVRGTR